MGSENTRICNLRLLETAEADDTNLHPCLCEVAPSRSWPRQSACGRPRRGWPSAARAPVPFGSDFRSPVAPPSAVSSEATGSGKILRGPRGPWRGAGPTGAAAGARALVGGALLRLRVPGEPALPWRGPYCTRPTQLNAHGNKEHI